MKQCCGLWCYRVSTMVLKIGPDQTDRFNQEPDLNPVWLLLKNGKTASLTKNPETGMVKPV